MTRLAGRHSSLTRREVDAAISAWEQGRLHRRSLLRRAALLGMSAPALAMLMGRA